jgi:hypothetical protein
MDTGAPEPAMVVDGTTLWVAYRAYEPDFPGWGHPDTDAYLEQHRGTEAFGVLRFDGIEHHHLGPPNDEPLHEHPLWGKGLELYAFHRLERNELSTLWIVTFHDETLEVTANTATASPMFFAANAVKAIEKIRQGT